MTTETAIHPFEAAGLGKAPFTYTGMEVQDVRGDDRVIGESGGVTVTTKPGGTCDYCGTYILDIYNIKSSDGKRFHVGCECVKKCCGPKLVAAVKKDAADAKKAKGMDRVKAAIARLTDPTVTEKLDAIPHPRGFKAFGTGIPLTMVDYVVWMFENAGLTGKLEAAKIVEKASA